jgi:hypothetical protein
MVENGLELKYDSESMNAVSRYSYCNVLQWWKASGCLTTLSTSMAVKKTSQKALVRLS